MTPSQHFGNTNGKTKVDIIQTTEMGSQTTSETERAKEFKDRAHNFDFNHTY